MPLPPYRTGEPYRLGIFLLGAYQEILGDMHNLFGDTAAVNVELSADGGYRLVEPTRGDTVADVLRYVRYEPAALLAACGEKSRSPISIRNDAPPVWRSWKPPWRTIRIWNPGGMMLASANPRRVVAALPTRCRVLACWLAPASAPPWPGRDRCQA